ncbi:MAG: metal-binding protein [Acidobacteria bacterium]|nr:metal-binding protein [Acidobacteriota bacterium]
MPSGKTHDAITVLLAVPTFVAAWGVTGSLVLAGVVTAATLFGGLMFGPDLDIQSRQYTRWGVLRFLWLPYKMLFRHRSRWSHGIVFGTLIRVVYFVGVLALIASVAFYVYMSRHARHARRALVGRGEPHRHGRDVVCPAQRLTAFLSER